jgi:hypothetical protein
MKKSIIFLIALVCFNLAYAQEFTLVETGKSKSRIIIPVKATDTEIKAARVLQDYIYRISGVRVQIKSDKKKPKSGEILVGNVNRSEIKNIALDKLEKDGFLLRNTGSKLMIAGGTEKGVLYGVYTFLEKYLSCRKYFSESAFVPKQKSIVLNPFEDLQIPVFTFREVYYRDAYDEEYMNWHKLDCHGEIGTSREWGFWCHSFSGLLSAEEYGETHPEYFSYYDGKRHPGSQLCLTNPDVLKIVIKNLRTEIDKNPEPLYWSVSQNDNTHYCRCPECSALDLEAGTSMGTMLPFINKVAEQFPDKIISTLAYQYTRKPPKNIVPAKNVNIMLCNIESPRHITIEKGDTAFCEDLAGWGQITDNIILWDYVIQFSNLIAPFPNLRTLQPNVQYFHKNRVSAVFEQANREIGGEFAELKAYLLAKLLWNPDVKLDEITDDFLEGYYGKASEMIKEYISLMHDKMEQSGARLDIFGNPVDARESFLSDSLITVYNQIFDRAEQLVASDPDKLNHVRTARLQIQYAILEIARVEKIGKRGAFVTDSSGLLKPDPGKVDILNKFHSQCKATGVTRVTEWNTTPQEYFEKYTKFFEENSGMTVLELNK